MSDIGLKYPKEKAKKNWIEIKSFVSAARDKPIVLNITTLQAYEKRKRSSGPGYSNVFG